MQNWQEFQKQLWKRKWERRKSVPGPEYHTYETWNQGSENYDRKAAVDLLDIDLVIYIGEEYPWTCIKLQDLWYKPRSPESSFNSISNNS